MLGMFTLHWLCVDNIDCFKLISLHMIPSDAHAPCRGPMAAMNYIWVQEMRNQTAFQTVEKIVDLKQSRLSTPSQYPQHFENGYCVIISDIRMQLDMAIDHIITYTMIYLVLLYLLV